MKVPGIHILKSYLAHLQTSFGYSRGRSVATWPQSVPLTLIPHTPFSSQGSSGTAKAAFQLEKFGDPSLLSQPLSPQDSPVPSTSGAVVREPHPGGPKNCVQAAAAHGGSIP